MSMFETVTVKRGSLINPVQLMDNKGMKPKDLKIAEGLIEENEDIIAQRWKEFFTNK